LVFSECELNYSSEFSLMERHEEYQYLELVKEIIENGHAKEDRTGTGTRSVFGRQLRFSLLNGKFPLLTTKKVFWKGVVEELLWFIKGNTNANELAKRGVHIWDHNGSKAFLNKIGLSYREEGDLGPIYGWQWRHYGATYKDMHSNYDGLGVDQLSQVINSIKTDPNSRRIIMTAWNPSDIPLMVLPPCHVLCQFYVNDGLLSCLMFQRSADMGLGVPFNIASYSLLTCMIAQVCGLAPGEFIHTIGDAHVYNNHVYPLKEQLQRIPRPFPKLIIDPNVKEIEQFQLEHFQLIDYNPHPHIPLDISV